jgi:outer membrane immunogenic protein
MNKHWFAGAALIAQIAGPALGADQPVITPPYSYTPPPHPAIYSWWTGCYLGGNLGGTWSRPEYTLDNTVRVETFTFTPLAVVGGGQLGCQYQWNDLVFGLEGTYSWANLRQDQPSTTLPNRNRSIGIDQIGTVAAKFGYAWDRTMLYGKAGWAGVRVNARAVNLATNEFSEFTDWSNGWTVGVGLEHVPWQNIVLGVEADFYGGIKFDHSGSDSLGVAARYIDTSAPLWAITVRASYLFGQPIVTRYVN